MGQCPFSQKSPHIVQGNAARSPKDYVQLELNYLPALRTSYPKEIVKCRNGIVITPNLPIDEKDIVEKLEVTTSEQQTSKLFSTLKAPGTKQRNVAANPPEP
ncbi:unnamed protein product [Haemonchus placei]|uniref:L51_S25_CI-B8 domain-containing protein n=1 Tax=Haemonchus placei TaxID=6290 RepID=A0A0N4WR74_HAEPC|nr:unnamed protein product [Haemonchus placei]